MAEYDDRERFIPYRKAEIVRILCNDGSLSAEDSKKFGAFCKILESLYHFEFHDKVEKLKNNYYPFNPDKDTKTTQQYSAEDLKKCEQTLLEEFEEVLNDANYEKLGETELQHAMEEESIFFKISLDVDFDDYDSFLICRRGDVVHKATVKKMFKKLEVDVPTFERVAMLIKFKNEAYFKEKGKKDFMFEPGSMVIKLFKNIPKADLEMLFPNTKVKMKLKDKLALGVPTIGGGLVLLAKKGIAIALAMPVLILLIRKMFGAEVVLKPADMALLIGAGAALAAIAGFGLKQWGKYKSRKIQFMKTLGDSLYFKNLDNNAGVFHHIIDAAEEEECKEAMLGYYFLLLSPDGLTEAKLDDTIEEWFEKKHGTLLDFEVDDALRKLKELKLCTIEGEGESAVYKALSIDKGCERLDYIWDNFFQYNV